MPATPITVDEAGALVGGSRVEHLLDETKLAVASDEGRLERHGASLTLARGDDARRPPQLGRLALALHLVEARIRVDDRGFRGSLRGLADEHGAGLGRRLDA